MQSTTRDDVGCFGGTWSVLSTAGKRRRPHVWRLRHARKRVSARRHSAAPNRRRTNGHWWWRGRCWRHLLIAGGRVRHWWLRLRLRRSVANSRCRYRRLLLLVCGHRLLHSTRRRSRRRRKRLLLSVMLLRIDTGHGRLLDLISARGRLLNWRRGGKLLLLRRNGRRRSGRASHAERSRGGRSRRRISLLISRGCH